MTMKKRSQILLRYLAEQVASASDLSENFLLCAI